MAAAVDEFGGGLSGRADLLPPSYPDREREKRAARVLAVSTHGGGAADRARRAGAGVQERGQPILSRSSTNVVNSPAIAPRRRREAAAHEYVLKESLDKILSSRRHGKEQNCCSSLATPSSAAAAVFLVAIDVGDGGDDEGDTVAAPTLLLISIAWRLGRREAGRRLLAVLVVTAAASPPTRCLRLLLIGQRRRCLALLGSLYGYLLPSADVQLYSAVVATVFYHQCMEQQRPELAIPVTMKAMKLGNTPINSVELIKGAIA
ncbi:hypothetical protein ZWY2020_055427 [Hordeum vulgare]|nr:hypothetical protein ZWY2020_055427 [Hordeum vulgare]